MSTRERNPENILVTGGSGFIGSNFIRYLFKCPESNSTCFMDADFDGIVVNADCMTYAANPDTLTGIEEQFGDCNGSSKQRYFFEKTDVCDAGKIAYLLRKYNIDTVVNFAAETHVDRSIVSPGAFIKTNIEGTYTLLEEIRNWLNVQDEKFRKNFIFHQVSTDEVYGSLGKEGKFTEESPYRPGSPYSASKASADMMTESYFKTYGLPVTISNCSNNYGPFQYPEKLIPLMIKNVMENKPLPVYGEGNNIRDWIFVEDHVRAIWKIITESKPGQKYTIGGSNEKRNNTLIDEIIEKEVRILNDKRGLKRNIQDTVQNIIHVNDRLGHDFRYSVDCSKIKHDLGWECLMPFEEGLSFTIDWYINNHKWLSKCMNVI